MCGGVAVRVGFHVDQLWFEAPGGIGTYVWELLSALSAGAPAVEFVTFRARWERPPSRAWTLSSPPVESRRSIRWLYPAWDLLGWPPLPPALSSCDVIHATNHAAVPPARAGQKLVVTVHDLAFERYPEAFPSRWLRLYRAGLRATARRADAIIAPSRATADDLAAHASVDPSKVHVVPLAAGLPTSQEPAEGVLERLGVRPPFILCPSTIEPRKNQARLVGAYRKLATDLPHALVLAGPDGWKHDDLDAAIAAGGPGTVVRTGRLDDREIDALYRAADVVAYPSLYEGFGLPVIEAMARGVPVVASTTPAVAETAGDAAMLVDPLDIDALTVALERVLIDEPLANDLRAMGLERAASFSWEATARGTLAVYRNALGAP
jgi:glycosyltransferase involved in cell wall biosynthesis